MNDYLKKGINSVVGLGVDEGAGFALNSRLKVTNAFCLLCITYTVPYILFSLYCGFYASAFVFSVAHLMFLLCLYFNKQKRYLSAKVLIVFTTNFSVFYVSYQYGFVSGLHLYYFTSPLIVFLLFEFKETRRIVLSILLYLLTILALILINRYGSRTPNGNFSNFAGILYPVNVFLALSFCILITRYFALYNYKINLSLADSNRVLSQNHQSLIAEVAERKNAEHRLEESLAEKEILLSEIHHRVKNNLAVISGMLELQMLLNENVQLKSVLSECRNRIKSIGLIHDSLYQYADLAKIEFSDYLMKLTGEIKKTYPALTDNIVLKCNSEEIQLDIGKAIPCGLIVNEVISNAYKHAFDQRISGEIDLQFVRENDLCVLRIRDNGNGNFKIGDSSRSSMGMSLIEAFTQQLEGQFSFMNENGTVFELTFA